MIEFDDWKVNFFRRSLFTSDKEVRFTFTEFEVLMILIAARNKVVTRDSIVRILKNNGVNLLNRSLDIIISRIRKKLNSECILTVRSVGYEFVPEVKFDENDHIVQWFVNRYTEIPSN